MIRLLTAKYKNNRDACFKLARCIGLADAPCELCSVASADRWQGCKHCEGIDRMVCEDLQALWNYAKHLVYLQSDMLTQDEIDELEGV